MKMDNYEFLKNTQDIFQEIHSFEPLKIEKAERLLSTVKDENSLLELTKLAKKEDFIIKFFVINHLGKFEYLSTIKLLVDFLSDENEFIRGETRRILNKIEIEEKYDFFLPLLTSPDVSIVRYVIKALGEGEQHNAVSPLLELFEMAADEIKNLIIDALRLIGDSRSDKKVVESLRDKSPSVRYSAAFYCGTRKIKKSYTGLLSLLIDEIPAIRMISAWSLGKLADRRCLKHIEKQLVIEKDENVKKELSRILLQNGDPKTLDIPLIEKICTEGETSSSCISKWQYAKISNKTGEMSDICLFVEGSYPYVHGGVSSWVHSLINYFKDIKFSIVHLAASSSEPKIFKYTLPDNVIYLEEVFLYDLPEKRITRKPPSEIYNLLYNFICQIDEKKDTDYLEVCKKIGAFDNLKIDIFDLFFSKEGWKFANRFYQSFLPDIPFLEYIWTYRSITLPLYNLLNARIPPAKLYYSALTGYAGLLAAISKIYYQKPLMITEHGIYHRERMMEIDQAAWIYEGKRDELIATEVFGGLKKVWIDMYEQISSIVYKFSDIITTLYNDNADIQVSKGADFNKISIIPNGMNIEDYLNIEPAGLKRNITTIALIGRVVAIKDIKTFIRAAKIVYDEMKGRVEFLILGPIDEDKDYAGECYSLQSLLGLDTCMKFTGNVNLDAFYKNIDIVVLTSISEGQPISIMEAMACGIPTVATNVGDCSGLLYGNEYLGDTLGKCGIVTNVHSPYETANAILKIINNRQLYNDMSLAAKKRIKTYYNINDVFIKYRKQFDKFIG